MRAYLESFDSSADEALKKLASSTDPVVIERRLSLLEGGARLAEAAELVKRSPRHRAWAETGVRVLVRNGDTHSARRLVEWATESGDVAFGQRVALAFAEAVRQSVAGDEVTHELVPPGISAADEEFLHLALEAVEPLLASIKANRRIEDHNLLELRTAEVAFDIHHMLGNASEIEEIASLLETKHPFSLKLASAALLGVVPAPPDLVHRLRAEHSELPIAHLLALQAESELLGRPEEAFKNALGRVAEAQSEEERQGLGRVIRLIAQHLGDDARRELAEIGALLPSDDTAIDAVLDALGLLNAGDLDAAGAVLDSVRNEASPEWLQVYAGYLVARGELVEAVRFVARAAEILPDPRLQRKTAMMAYEAGQLEVCRASLERLVTWLPRDAEARRNLAGVLVDLEDFEGAASQFNKLQLLEPDVNLHLLNEAVCYLKLGDLDKSLELLDTHLASEGPQQQDALIQKSKLLHAMGRAKESFSLLDERRGEFWTEPAYLVNYMMMAYAAEKERAAHEAFVRLMELQRTGKVEPAVFEPKTLEDLATHMEEFTEKRTHLYSQLIRCRAPWLLVDEALGNVSFWSWRLRTQSLPWLSEHKESHAAHLVFSTNSFTLEGKGGRASSLVELATSDPGVPVVADLSALLTLDRLGLLDLAAGYAGRVLVPSAYRGIVADERARLLHHQPSRVTALRKVKAALDLGELTVASQEDETSLKQIDEYSPIKERSDVYRILDLARFLHRYGHISDPDYQRLDEFDLGQPVSGPEKPPLVLGEPVVASLNTLRSLATRGLLEPALEALRIMIPERDLVELRAGLKGTEYQEELWNWHRDLWTRLPRHEAFCFVNPSPEEALITDSEKAAARDVHLAAVQLALSTKTPLLIDDRALQTVVLNERAGEAGAAFGTDRLINGLLDAGLLNLREAADAYRKLLEWRYCYLVVPVEVLVEFARRYREHPPGRDLRCVASYVQMCIASPGLLGGPEPGTAPPISLAQTFFLAWTSRVADFLMDIWSDGGFKVETAETLTLWATREFLPAVPLTAENATARLLPHLKKYIMGRALVRCLSTDNQERANRGLRSLGASLGLSDREYVELVAEVIHEYGPKA